MKPTDIQYASIYDSFTITVLMQIEDLGFCEKGQGGRFVSDGNLISRMGELPLNTDGGGLVQQPPGEPRRHGGRRENADALTIPTVKTPSRRGCRWRRLAHALAAHRIGRRRHDVVFDRIFDRAEIVDRLAETVRARVPEDFRRRERAAIFRSRRLPLRSPRR